MAYCFLEIFTRILDDFDFSFVGLFLFIKANKSSGSTQKVQKNEGNTQPCKHLLFQFVFELFFPILSKCHAIELLECHETIPPPFWHFRVHHFGN
jgi:hypothetical protein